MQFDTNVSLSSDFIFQTCIVLNSCFSRAFKIRSLSLNTTEVPYQVTFCLLKTDQRVVVLCTAAKADVE